MPKGRTILIGGFIAAIATAIAVSLTWRGTGALPGLTLTETGLAEVPELSGRRVNSPGELDDLLRDRSFAGRVI
ncbi:MAG: hypothetical protein ACRD1U_10670, partial [Vicinamibacterales bacterium]